MAIELDTVWVFSIFGLAAFSTYLVCRRFVALLKWPQNILIGLVLYVLLQLIPIHLTATLELSGIIASISFGHIAIFGVLILLGLLVYSSRISRVPMELPRFSVVLSTLKGTPGYLQATILVIVTLWLIFSIDMLTSYPTGWDALDYHLPVAVRWLQTKSLGIPAYGDWHYSLPANAEIHMMLLLASGGERFATVFNILAFLIAAVAIYVIAFRVTEKSYISLLTVILFASLPIVQFQAFSGYVDLYGSSFILAGIAIFTCRFESFQGETNSIWYATFIFLSGCAWGIAIGTKPTFYIYAALCFISASVMICAERKKHHRSVYYLLTLLLMGALLPSLYWFLRALYETGNPFYPLKLEVAGITIFDGWKTTDITPINYDREFVRSTLEWLFYPWVEYKKAGYSYGTGSGLGAVWATFVPVGIGYGAYLMIKNIKKKDFLPYSILMGSLIVGSVIWWYFLRRMPRFGIPLLAIACILTAPLFDLLTRRQLGIFRYLILLSVTATSILAASKPAHYLLGRIRTGAWQRAAIYGYPSLIDQLPKYATVLNLGASMTQNFPLAGASLSNEVIPPNWLRTKSVHEFVEQKGVDFIVGVHPFSSTDLGETRVRLLFEGEVGKKLWRIWEVKKPF